ncbi:MAG: class I SAM-dependent methyltransferase [Candidatus Hodarchaeota archaeon]
MTDSFSSNRKFKLKEIFSINVPWITKIPVHQANCLLCKGRNIVPLNTFILNGKRFYTVRCLTDGMIWLDPQPTEEFYHQLYTEHYHAGEPDDPLLEQATLDVHSDEKKLREIAVLRLNELEQFTERGRLLEVGFGSGHVLFEAQARGWDVVGIEVASSCVENLRSKIPVICTDLLEYKEQQQSFDVIAMYSVIEHVHKPIAYLERAYELLKPDGILVLRLPDTPAQGPPASLIAHLYHFNQSTISELLNRCGFKVLDIGSFALWKPKKYPGELWSMNVLSRKISSRN